MLEGWNRRHDQDYQPCLASIHCWCGKSILDNGASATGVSRIDSGKLQETVFFGRNWTVIPIFLPIDVFFTCRPLVLLFDLFVFRQSYTSPFLWERWEGVFMCSRPWTLCCSPGASTIFVSEDLQRFFYFNFIFFRIETFCIQKSFFYLIL